MKKYSLIMLVLSSLSYSQLNGTVSVGYEKEIQGEFLSAERLSKSKVKVSPFYVEKNINKFTYYNAEISNEYLTLGARQINNSIKLKASIQTNSDRLPNAKYSVETNLNDDRIEKLVKGTVKHKLNIWYQDKIDFRFNYDKYTNEEELYLNLKYFNVYANRKQTHDLETSLKDMRNTQIKIADNDDGHGHDKILDVFSYLPYSLEDAQRVYRTQPSFKSVEYNIGAYKDFEYKDTNLSLFANYKHKKLKNGFSDKLVSDIKGNEFLFGINAEKYFIPKLKTKVGFNIEHLRYREEKTEDKAIFWRGKTEFFRNAVEEGVIKTKFALDTELAYTFNPTAKLDITLGLKSKFSLTQYRNLINKEVLENRKRALEDNEKEVLRERENLGEDAIKALEEKIKPIKEKVKQAEEKLEAFDSKTDFSAEIDAYNINTFVFKGEDANVIKDEFKNSIADMNFDSIEKYINDKSKEKLELEKKNNISISDARKLRINTRISKEENIENIKIAVENLNVKNPMEFAEKYVELYKYTNIGVYGRLKSSLVNARSVITREINTEKRNLKKEESKIYVDEDIKNAYENLYKQTQNSYTFDMELNPYAELNYKIYKGLSMNAKASMVAEFRKDITKKTKMSNHIHFNFGVGLKYEF